MEAVTVIGVLAVCIVVPLAIRRMMLKRLSRKFMEGLQRGLR